jgi:uncharacterized protein
LRTETVTLPSDSPGTARTLTRHVWGQPGARPKVHIQAALHADEMPGAIVAHHLMDLLDKAEAEGRIMGEVAVLPLANPIGLGHWLAHKPQGRQDLGSLQNFNRHYPDLAALAGDDLAGRLTDDADQNVTLIRATFAAALDQTPPKTEIDALRIALLKWSHDADHVLDLHCDHFAVLHLYASPARPDTTALLCRSTGARLALIAEVSGGNAFDEAHTAAWAALRARFSDRHPIPAACFSTTLEYRGQFDVDDGTAADDAANLMTFLAAIAAISGPAAPRHPDARHLPLAAAPEVTAPQGGIVTWAVPVGADVREGQTLGHVTDPLARLRLPFTAPCAGLLFRVELWRSCLRGQILCQIAGETIVRTGNLMSD